MTESGAQLQPVATATTVSYGGDAPVVADGPFSEAKEVIGGFQVIDVSDLDAAIAVVKTWPMLELPVVAVEIRPIISLLKARRAVNEMDAAAAEAGRARTAASDRLLARVIREESARIVAALTHWLGSLDLTETAGVPPFPGAG